MHFAWICSLVVVAVVDMVALPIQLLCVPEAGLDGEQVFDRDSLHPHRHDQGEDELGHRMKTVAAATTIQAVIKSQLAF